MVLGLELLVAMPGKIDFVVQVPGLKFHIEPTDLPFDKVVRPDLPCEADAIERVPGATAVTQNVLPHPPTGLVDDLPSEQYGHERHRAR